MKNLLFKFGILSAILLLDILNLASAANYCDPTLCTVNGDMVLPHIGCKHDGKFVKNCIEPVEIKVTPHFQQIILHTHNDLRNKVANGSLPGFQSAKRMTTMTWDSDLSYLGSLNVRTCEMEHDACHNTVAYKYSGQNIGIHHQTRKMDPTEYESLIIYLINAWFNEYNFTTQHDVDMCARVNRPNEIGHFTAMVQEKSAKVGCGIARFIKNMMGKKWDTILLTCNYSFGNVVGLPIYVKGPMCSGCQTGCNPEFNGLCSVSENVPPVPVLDDDEDPPDLSSSNKHQANQFVQPVKPPKSVKLVPAAVPSPRPIQSGQTPQSIQSVQPPRPVPTHQASPNLLSVPATQQKPSPHLLSVPAAQQKPSPHPVPVSQHQACPHLLSVPATQQKPSPYLSSVPAPQHRPSDQACRPVTSGHASPHLASVPPVRQHPSVQAHRPGTSGQATQPVTLGQATRPGLSGPHHPRVSSFQAPRSVPPAQCQRPVPMSRDHHRVPPDGHLTNPPMCSRQPVNEATVPKSRFKGLVHMATSVVRRLFELIIPRNNRSPPQ